MTRVLVLGGYGLIGSACLQELKRRAVHVTGMGRSDIHAKRAHPDIDWIIADIAALSVEDWRAHLVGVDVVINAAGALQEGARDSLTAIHETTIANLCTAAAGSAMRVVQISAAGAELEATTEFMRSKARGDARLAASDLDWIILRPTLVIGANAYGGTALLRGLAGFPLCGMQVFSRADPPVTLQTIALDELAHAVADCAVPNGNSSAVVPSRQSYDLTETPARSFADTVAQMRDWLGFAPHPIQIRLPNWILRPIARAGDGLGWLGWRAPLRSTTLDTLSTGVRGDPEPWRAAGGRDFSPLPQTLRNMPATLQDRWFAQMYLMLPAAVAVLSLFWLVSGLIGLWQFSSAQSVLTTRGIAPGFAALAVIGGAVANIALGALILVRPWARRACIGMVAVTLAYLFGATLFAPDLWGDPLGPMVKTLPAAGLALLTYAMLEDR